MSDDLEVQRSKFAPTPQHGAAYGIVIDRVGGVQAIADCNTQDKMQQHVTTLDAIRRWALVQQMETMQAYLWGIDRVTADLKSRLAVHENARKVSAARAALPMPPDAGP